LILTVHSYRGRYFTCPELNESASENEDIAFMDLSQNVLVVSPKWKALGPNMRGT